MISRTYSVGIGSSEVFSSVIRLAKCGEVELDVEEIEFLGGRGGGEFLPINLATLLALAAALMPLQPSLVAKPELLKPKMAKAMPTEVISVLPVLLCSAAMLNRTVPTIPAEAVNPTPATFARSTALMGPAFNALKDA